MNLKANLELVRQEYLRRMTGGNGQLLQQVEFYITERLGKMLRPQLTLLAADTLGQANNRRTLLLATAVEMLHNASLLHDDVIDHSENRRGKPSVNAHWNNAIAVLVGDYHLTSIMDLLCEINDNNVTRRINNTVKAMVEAELLQQESQQVNKSTSQINQESSSTYLKIIDGKTAHLFATACALGNPLYEEFGLHYGRLFQLRDDLSDGEATPFTKDLIQKEVDTLNTIKHTLPIPIM
ncbi:MAG: polyprenyl synthetase family protein [bacterium]